MPPEHRSSLSPVRLSRAAFTGLGAGDGDPVTRSRLRRAQRSRHLLLLREVVRTVTGPAADDVTGWYAVLGAAEQRAPGPVRRLLGHPPVGAWAAACLAALRAGRPAGEAGVGYLATLAAAAALHARLDTTLTVPVSGGVLPLPTLGAATLPGARTAVVDATARTITGGGHRIAVPEDGADAGPGWQGLRRLVTGGPGPRLSVLLDDLDPYRAPTGVSPSGRLTDAAAARWQSALDDGWRLLLARHRPDALTLAADLRMLVPLRDENGAGISATSKHAFGAVAMSEPADPTGLAVGLLHETRHSRLNAVQALFPLHEPAPETRLYSPWRDDPRPVGGLLHGAYAYLAVADFWRVERDAVAPTGQFTFARWRAAVVDATTALLTGGRLTPAGTTFVAAMRERARSWLAEPVPPAVTYLAEQANTDHRLRWRLRHLAVEPSGVHRLAGAWSAGRPPGGPVRARLRPAGGRQLERNARLDRVHARLRGAGDPPGGCPGDRAYARGDEAAAAHAYRAALIRRPDDDAAWAGLALTGGPATLRARPELVAAVYRAVRLLGGPGPDLDALARWLAPVPYDDGGVAAARAEPS